VVLVHGDTHEHRVNRPWGDVPNFIRIETYARGSDKWVQVRVDPGNPDVFTISTQS
jgi:hypothetical protein